MDKTSRRKPRLHGSFSFSWLRSPITWPQRLCLASESFHTVRSAGFGEVLRGVSWTPEGDHEFF